MAAEPTPARRDALIVANDAYEDPRLRRSARRQRTPRSSRACWAIAEIGGFGSSLAERARPRRAAEAVRASSTTAASTICSCSTSPATGLKDEDGTLYFASVRHRVEHLEATAIPSEFVNRQMTRSRSRRIVLLLDCCYSGAFATRADEPCGRRVDIRDRFDGRGRVVLTASSAMEYAFEGDELAGEGKPSVFTSALVRGLTTGEADRDRDGSSRSTSSTTTRTSGARGDAVTDARQVGIRRAGRPHRRAEPFEPEPEPDALPVELLAAMESPFANVRAGAVEELARLSVGADAGLAAAARLAIAELADDDSKRVSETATSALAGAPPEPAVRPSPAQPAREPGPSTSSAAAGVLARAARWQDAIALVRAALFVLAYFQTASTDAPSSETAWFWAKEAKEAIWALWWPSRPSGQRPSS